MYDKKELGILISMTHRKMPREAMTPLLEVQSLSVGVQRGRETLLAVADMSFHICPGEILGIVGESGCGKTLTARSIPGLLPPGVRVMGGHISFKGLDLQRLSAKELCHIRGKELSMVFQEPMSSLNPLLKIGQQIGESLELHGMKDKNRLYAKTLDVMQRVGLPEPKKLAAAYPHQLSGGMCQRVMIALGILCEPKLLIADEPTTALDLTTQAQIVQLLKRINQEFGTSILFISHDLGVIRQLCDRVLVMYAGKLVESGAVGDIFSYPQHEYTKGLIGSIPSKEHKGKPLVNIPGKVPSIEEIKQKGSCCSFAPRCLWAEEICFTRFPDKISLQGDHQVYCWVIAAKSEAEYAGI